MPAALIAAGAQAALGLGQMLFSGKKKNEKALLNYVNSYKPNASIMDYYNKALSRYDANAYNSQAYKTQTNTIGRNLATGIGAAQTRRGGLSSLGTLVQGANDASQRAVVNAENQQAQQLSQLGQATGMKAAEDRRKFDMIYNLKAQKAGQSAGVFNSGISNLFGGLSNGASILGGMGKKDTTSTPTDTYDYTGNRTNTYA